MDFHSGEIAWKFLWALNLVVDQLCTASAEASPNLVRNRVDCHQLLLVKMCVCVCCVCVCSVCSGKLSAQLLQRP